MSTIQVLDYKNQVKQLNNIVLDELANQIRGQIILPGDAAYDKARSLWNAMIDKRPAFIVQCSGAADVCHAVKFAKQHDLLISVRGAGHNIAGRALSDKVMLIDLEKLRTVSVDANNKTAVISPGATLGDIDHETQLYGLALPIGINSTTGIAGLTLGGGFGWLSRRHAMTVDNLISAEVVTTSGNCLSCDNKENSDLFWAIKGGGGNFGIVTSFKFQLQEVGPEVMAGPIIFDINEAKKVLIDYREFCKINPEDMSVWSILRKAPPFPFLAEQYHGKPVLIMACMHLGSESEAAPLIEKVRQFGHPIGDGFGPHVYTQFQAAFDPLLTPGSRNYWKSHNFKTIDDGMIDLLIQYAATLPSDGSEIFMAQMGGATNRIASGATAYPHRDIEFIMNVHTRWEDIVLDKKCIDWARAFFNEAKPYATGGVYSNFVSEGDDSTDDAYASNFAKLARIKAKYDPDNRLRSNLNITPG